MQTWILSVWRLLLILTLFTAPSGVQARERPQKLTIGGAQSLIPLAETFSSRFLKNHPGVEIEIRGGGSTYAVNAAGRGEIDIGLVARGLDAAEKQYLYEKPFGHDAIFLVTYPGNPVGSLTLEQIRRIYLGQITNWRDVGGEDQGIIPLTRESSSNIHAIFIQHLFGGNFNGQEKAFTLRTSKEKILKTIKRVRGSIGYGILHLEQAEAEGVRVLGIEGKLPTGQNIDLGLYPLTRPLLLISPKTPEGIVEKWMRGFVQFNNNTRRPEEQH
jgi:phosphate transport system substrate-binding protein